MITKCDFPGCEKAGTCRAPKSRDLKEYFHFCRDHAAEYNKNWNFYSGMTNQEIDDDWERQTFGEPSKKQDNDDYVKFINDFLTGRSEFDKIASKKTTPSNIINALKVFDLSISANWREIGNAYRKLAKTYHPDIAKDKISAAAQFTKITEAYKILETYYKKKKA